MKTAGKTKLVVGLVLAAASSTAWAELIPIGPFTGELSESWETFPTIPQEGAYLPNPTTIMGGAATIANPYMMIYEPGVWDFGLADSGYAQVADGAKGMGIGRPQQTATITFAEPVVRFGAYWAATTGPFNGDPANIGVSFFDQAGALIGSDAFAYTRPSYDGLLEWHGWFSSEPIKILTYTEDRVVLDALQASIVPEPTAGWLIACVVFACYVLRRR